MPEQLKPVFEVIRAEYEQTVAEVLAITGESTLLERQPVLDRTLGVRDSYLEPLHHLQVSLLPSTGPARPPTAGAWGGGAESSPDPALERALLTDRQRHRRRHAQHRLNRTPAG